MLYAKKIVRLFIIMIVLCALFLGGCQSPVKPTISELTGTIPSANTITPTMQAQTSTQISLDKVELIVQSAIREDTQVIFFNDKLQSIQSFESHMASPFLSVDKCQFISLSYKDSRFFIETYDFTGRLIDNKLVNLADTETHYIYDLIMSPDGKWISYKETSGDYGMSYADGEIQDVNIVSVVEGKPQESFRVSQRRGAKWSNPSWSPDGRGLLYTDLDQEGRHQIFHFDPETRSRTQMTKFEIDYSISDLEWSRNSRSFAFFYFDILGYESGKAEVNGGIGMVTVATMPTTNIIQNLTDVIQAQIFWRIDGEQLLVLAQRAKDQPSVLFWYDLASQSVIHSIESTSFDPQWKIYSAFPLAEDLTSVGLLGHSVYIYNLTSHSYFTVDDRAITDRLLLGDLHIFRDASGNYEPTKCELEK